ncbi:class I SAM-dependent methyltransferase [Streptomyces sp. CA-251387]|uniref:class I SAM-dependent methyltransferase n=1 Tax=Streptomyces sp. CA-251387 TaxID=3240064 RepID=UPI003D8CF302
MLRSLEVTEQLNHYINQIAVRRATPEVRELIEETSRLPDAEMQVPPQEGQFLSLLVKAIRAKRVLEIGVFTGYSALCTARALPIDGSVIALDNNETVTMIARRHWERAGISHKIDLRIGDASETLRSLLAESANRGAFDFAFIDADKENYEFYYESALHLVRVGGLIAADNTLWGGAVADPEANDSETVALRKFNMKVHGDSRVEISLLPMADGITLALRVQ